MLTYGKEASKRWASSFVSEIPTVCARMGELFQTGRHEETSQRNGRMGKAKNQGGLLETMEESQDKVPNAESIRVRTLESERTCLQQKRPLAYGASLKPNLFK